MSEFPVIPAQAGIQSVDSARIHVLDSRLRGSDDSFWVNLLGMGAA
jgi:hypothetical protein